MKFREDINIPNTLSDMNVPDTRAEEIGVRALGDPTAASNPISHDAATYSAIFCKACEGSLS